MPPLSQASAALNPLPHHRAQEALDLGLVVVVVDAGPDEGDSLTLRALLGEAVTRPLRRGDVRSPVAHCR